MHRIITLFFIFPFSLLYAQHNFELYNKGAVLKIESGADIYILGDVHMSSAIGLLENYGLMEVEGNMYADNLFQQRGSGTVRLHNRLVNIGQPQSIIGADGYVVRGGYGNTGVNDGSFYRLELANDIGQIYLSGNGNVADVRNRVDFRPLGGITNRIITASAPPTALPTNGSLYPGVFGIMNLNPSIAAKMLNNTITANGNTSSFDSGYVQGKLRMAVNPAGGDYGFPVGLEPAGAGAQRGIQYFSVNLGANTYDVLTTYFQTASGNVVSGTPVDCGGNTIDYFGGADHGEWVINEIGGNTGDYSITVYPQDDNFPSLPIWVITKDDQLTGTADECGLTPVGLTRSGYNGFSEFGVAGATILLPVELTTFVAYPVNNEFIQTKWVTVSELNSAYFQVERSTDAIHFFSIGIKQAAGNSNQPLTYLFDDIQVQPDILYYYRLKMVDKDSSYSYSTIRPAKITGNRDATVIVYPNPVVSDNISILLMNITGEISVKLYNDLGQSIYHKSYSIDNTIQTIQLDNIALADGIYMMVIENNTNRWTKKLLKK